ncbi:MAG: sulfotransferase [Alphaproteobacteria bacterium]
MNSAKPFFIVSSGRSGTKLMEKLFSALPEVEMNHEYMVHHVQPAAVKHHLGLACRHETRYVLAQTHKAAVDYCEKPHWGDSSNKLTWVIELLDELFPEARFVHLVRDGRKVASSYFHKLADECYADRSTATFARYIDNHPNTGAPPPEKKYWWPQPRRGAPDRAAFLGFGQFERIAWHWAESNRTALSKLKALSPERRLFMRLEDLTADPAQASRLLDFLGLPHPADVRAILAKPHNVNRPVDRMLTAEDTRAFWPIAGDMMRELGYDQEAEYAVNY